MNNEPNPRRARHRAQADDAARSSSAATSRTGAAGAAGAAGARPAGADAANASGPAGADAANASGESTGGVPLRGLAMILLAVGAGLALWGVFMLTGSGDDTTNANSETSQSANQDANQNGSQSGQSGDASQNGQSNKPGQTAQNSDQSDSAKSDASKTSTSEKKPSASKPAPATDVKKVPITVLNNSLVPKLADTVAGKLADDGWTTGKTGNWAEAPDGSGNIAETTVFYSKNNADEKAAAEALAAELGVKAKPRFAELDQASQGVTLILTSEL